MNARRKVVNLQTGAENSHKEFPANDAFQAGQLIRNEITRSVKRGAKLKDIAQRAKLSRTTVSKLYYGETKFPRYDTIMKLMKVFNFNVYVRRMEKN